MSLPVWLPDSVFTWGRWDQSTVGGICLQGLYLLGVVVTFWKSDLLVLAFFLLESCLLL